MDGCLPCPPATWRNPVARALVRITPAMHNRAGRDGLGSRSGRSPSGRCEDLVTRILGLSAYYHDSAAALIIDGRIVAAAQEERFSRKKHDARFPSAATRYCLEQGNCRIDAIDQIVFYDKPLLKFERLLETYVALAPRGFRSFVTAMPIWLKDKLYLKMELRRELAALGGITQDRLPPLLFTEHHEAHAASAFFPSPFANSAVLCLDGVGEWATTSAWMGSGSTLEPLWQIDFPHSLGLLYSAFTYHAGFRVNSGEYKLMGLAPYGEPRFRDEILEELIDLKPDGSFRLNLKYFNFATGLTMTNRHFDQLFGGPPRKPESPLEQRHMDLASSVQSVTEEIVLRLGQTLHRETGATQLCMAGGVALNCVANGRLRREGPFETIWVQPAAGDAGGAVGAALAVWHQYLDQPREANGAGDGMSGSYLGPSYRTAEVEDRLRTLGAAYEVLDDEPLWARLVELLAEGRVVGWFQGRMEFGPRALGARSIIADPRNPSMQSNLNQKIKFRESFRPFAPAVLAERVSEFFEHEGASPYMLFVAPLRTEWRLPVDAADAQRFGIDRLHVRRSRLPAVTHVDYSARLQSVHRETNPRFHALLKAFEQATGFPALINTSFNVRGEPIVNTPEEAYRCFMRTGMDYLVIENCLLDKREQPEMHGDDPWQDEFPPD